MQGWSDNAKLAAVVVVADNAKLAAVAVVEVVVVADNAKAATIYNNDHPLSRT